MADDKTISVKLEHLSDRINNLSKVIYEYQNNPNYKIYSLQKPNNVFFTRLEEQKQMNLGELCSSLIKLKSLHSETLDKNAHATKPPISISLCLWDKSREYFVFPNRLQKEYDKYNSPKCVCSCFLYWCYNKRDLEGIKFLNSIGYDIHMWDDHLIKDGCKDGWFELVKYLVDDCGFDVKSESSWNLQIAVAWGNRDVIKYLIQKGSYLKFGMILEWIEENNEDEIFDLVYERSKDELSLL